MLRVNFDMFTNISKRVKSLLSIAAMLVFMYYICNYFLSPNDAAKAQFESIRQDQWKGVVVGKNIKQEHNIPVLIVEQGKSKKEIDLYFDRSWFFHRTSVGDSIIKNAGAVNVEVKNAFKDTVMTIDFGIN